MDASTWELEDVEPVPGRMLTITLEKLAKVRAGRGMLLMTVLLLLFF